MVVNLRRLRRVAGILVLIYAVYALLMVYVLPPVARHQVQTRVSALLGRPVTLTGIYLNPFTLSLRVQGFEVWEADGQTLFAGVQRVDANLDLTLSILQRGLVVSAVTVEEPHAVVVRRADSSFNFSDLAKPRGGAASAPPAAAPGPAARSPRFSVSNIRVRGGWFLFRDEVVHARQRLTDVNLAVPSVSSLPNHSEVYVAPAFRARLNGRDLALYSQAKPFADSQESSGEVRFRDLDLTALARYLPEPRNVDLTSGRLDVDLRLHSRRMAGQSPTVSVSGDVVWRDLRLTGRDGLPVAGVSALRLSILPTDLLKKEVHLSRIACTAPFFRLTRDAKGTLVLPQVGAASAPAPTAAPAPAAAPAGPPAPLPVTVDVDAITVEQGRLEFADAAVSPAFHTALDFELEVTGASTRPDRQVQVRFQAATEAKETASGTYTATLFPQVSVTGTTTIKDVRLPKYMPYLDKALACAVARGTLSLKIDHAVTLPAGAAPAVKVSDLDLAVNDFCLTAGADQAPVVTFQELTVTDATADLGAREAVVGAFATRGGEVRVQRLADGSLNLQKLVPAGPAAPVAASAAAATPAPAAAPWTVTVRDATVAGWNVLVDDRQPGTPVQVAVRDIAVSVKDLSTRAGQKGTLTLGLRLNESATLAVTGGFGVQPPTADLSIKLNDLGLKDFQGYVSERLKLLISDGALATDLQVAVAQASDGSFGGTVDGMVALRRFVSVDQVHSEDFVKCGELALRGLHVDLKPLAVRLGEVAINGLDTAVTIRPDGVLNLLSVLNQTPAAAGGTPPPAAPAPPPPAATPAASAAGPALPLEIALVRLDGCRVVFTDQQVSPYYRVSLDDLGGTVTSFSLGKPTPAQVSLVARFDGNSPFTLQATLADLGPRMTLTVATSLKGFELSPVTPYSGRYVGYAVQKGKLSFDLQYALNQRQLVAEHKILIDQLGFGQKVESADATDLPVRLAVALLKDRRGRITFDVPVRGSLDDPEFSVLRIVLKVLRDLVVKAATAPFSVLGALVGGGEELSYVEFGPGSADLDDAAAKRLESLAKALQERPELQVETGGVVDPASDREGLARQAVLRQVKARKLADLVKAGAPAGSVDEVPLSPEERDALLLALHRETLAPPPVATPAAPPAPVAPPPAPTPAEIEQQLMARVTVADEDVNLLAGRRAGRVREYLTTTGQVAAERVFVVDSAPAPAPGNTAPVTRQARLSLR